MEPGALRILLVEDDEDDYLLTLDYFSRFQDKNFTLSWVQTVEEALARIDSADVLLVDFFLGVRNGLELVREAVALGCKAPIILLTGKGSYELDLTAMRLGVTDYITKEEVTPSILERSIRYSLERKRIEEALREVQEDLEVRVKERTQELEETNRELLDEIARRDRMQKQLVYQAYILENVNDAIVASDENFHITMWNKAAEKIFGWRAEEAIGRPIKELVRTELDNITTGELLEILTGSGHYQGEALQYNKDHQPVNTEYTLVALRDGTGGISGYVGVIRDITERKRMEADLAEVNRRLIDGREAERLHLSQELHDGPVQSLYALSYQLAEMSKTANVNQGENELAGIQDMVQHVIQTLRYVCVELRPPTLNHHGLEQTILSHAQQFRVDNPDIQLSLALYKDKHTLPEHVRVALFRIYQHAMTNIVRHAGAKHVNVVFKMDAEQVYLEIHDDGRGFRAPDRWIDLVRKGHLGLAVIAERVEAIGGVLAIRSAPNEGTSILVRAPITNVIEGQGLGSAYTLPDASG